MDPNDREIGAPTTPPPTAAEVLYANELRRGALWVRLSCHLALNGLGAALLIEAPGTSARLALAGGCGVLLIASLIGLRRLRRRDRYGFGEAALYSYLSLACVLPAYHFFGWLSFALVPVCLGGVVYAMGHSTGAVVAMGVATSATHLTIGGLTIAGVLPDVGVASLRIDDTARAVLVLAGSQGLFLFAYLVGRRLRIHGLEGVEHYGAAVRESTRRQVLLQEAVDELHQVRKVGGPGRFTGLELGSFRLGVVLGRGGMGEVYEAAHLRTGAPAAVKVLSTSPRDETAARRFAREISIAAALDSPHVVRVIEHSSPGGAMPYLAMERLQGNTLSEELRGRLEMSRVLLMLREVAVAVDLAHRAGIVHRDLKPQNIFHHEANGEDLWKVLDFGVSRLAETESTLTGIAMVGTPGYMSPEQTAGRSVDHRSDLFSLGCIAYRSLTGRPAFFASDVPEILHRVEHEMPARPSAVAPLPREVDWVLAIALAKRPEERFGSASALVDALTDACSAKIQPDLRVRGEAIAGETPWGEPGARTRV
ncbi:MAG: serine/threonine protein kinase [Deltaproteobacteria bacterium]|nr:serine/threonine protein kinase [Deltaproteobacteria bacterium]